MIIFLIYIIIKGSINKGVWGGYILQKKFQFRLRNMTIEKRLGYSFFFLSLIPIIIVGSLATTIAKYSIIEKSTNYIVQLVDIVKDNLQNELKGYEAILNDLMVDSLIQKTFYVYDESTTAEKAYFSNKISDILINKIASYPDIRDVKMINLDEKVIYQRGYLLNDESHIKDIMSSIKEIGGTLQCFIQPIYGTDYIVLSKKINSIYTQKEVGYILFIIKEDVVRSIYDKLDLGEGANIYLIDEKNQILSSQYEEAKEHFNDKLLNAFEKAIVYQAPYFEYSSGLHTYTIVGSRISKFRINCMAMIPYSHFLKEIYAMIEKVILLIIGCFFLSFILSKYICKSIIDPLKKLKEYIESAMEQKFYSEFRDDSPDELGELGRNYIEINNEMHEMIKKIERDEKERRELELNMLQAQINPHFLFNTLNSLRWIAMMSGAQSVSEGILALSDLLKNTIIQKNQYISIRDELENVHNYMLIQTLRYGDSFKLHIQVEEELMTYQTLKFILQPIVENSIIHGMRDGHTLLNIYIKLIEEEDSLLFEINDDGKGFDKGQMIKGIESKDIRLSGIGINNVIDRIRINYGTFYGGEIMSQIDKGTQVKLRIPKMREA